MKWKLLPLVVVFALLMSLVPTPAMAQATATRTLPDAAVGVGAQFEVGIDADGFGSFGQVVETLPDGFTYVDGSATAVSGIVEDTVAEAVDGQNVTFTFLCASPISFTYNVTAPDTAGGPFYFAGVLQGATADVDPIGGDTEVNVGEVPDEVFAWIDLGVGWRTFSTPIALASGFNTWGDLVALGELEVEVAYYFDGSSQNWGLVLADYPVVPCDAIYVLMLSPGTVPIVPNPDYTAPATKELYPDWNLVGLAALDDMGVIEALISVYIVTGDLTGYAQVLSPAINAPNDWVYVRDTPYLHLMVVGKGFWVFMINGGTLAGFTSTPLP